MPPTGENPTPKSKMDLTLGQEQKGPYQPPAFNNFNNNNNNNNNNNKNKNNNNNNNNNKIKNTFEE